MPIPPNGTTTAKCDANLMWLAGYGAQAHSVYFGMNKTAVMVATMSSPEFITTLTAPGNIIELHVYYRYTILCWFIIN